MGKINPAASILENKGEIDAAVKLLKDVCDWDGVASLIMKHARALLAQGRNLILEEWLGLLPEEIIDHNPWILYWFGVIRLPFNPSIANTYFERAFERFKTNGDSEGLLLSWSGIVDSIGYGLKDFKPLDLWISALNEIMRDSDNFPTMEIEASVASSMVMALSLRQPHNPDIESWIERVLSLPDETSIICAKIKTILYTMYYRMTRGDMLNIPSDISLIQHLNSSPEIHPLAKVTAIFAETFGYNLIGVNNRCRESMVKCSSLSRDTGILIFENFMQGYGISSALDANDLVAARKGLNKLALSMNLFRPLDIAFYRFLKTRDALIHKDFIEASLHIDIALKMAMDVGFHILIISCHILKAYLLHELGREREASEYLEHALKSIKKKKCRTFEFSAYLARAEFAFDHGDEEYGFRFLRKAMSLGKEGGYLNIFIDRPAVTARLCAMALEAGIEKQFVQGVIRRRSLLPDKLHLYIEEWPWSIKIYTLGRFALTLEGKQIRFLQKSQQKPLAMFKVLIALGGREVREELLVDILWPETDGDAGHRSLVTTLQRLRLLVGDNKVIQRREGRLTIDTRYCWVDTWAFERILGEAEKRRKEGLMEEAFRLTDKAIALYIGSFLSCEAEMPWLIPLRERLRGRFLRNLIWMGRYMEKNGQFEKAIDCYLRGVDTDETAEELYQLLMICYHHVGLKTEAIKIYQKCKRILSIVLGVEPSERTTAIYQSLLS